MSEGSDICLSVIIPVYNEQDRMPSTLGEVFDYFAGLPGPCECIVVDDGSLDRSAEVTRSWMAGRPQLRLISLECNQGKGAAVRQGMLQAKGRYRLFLDADGSMRMRQFDAFLPILAGGADVVIASRRIPGAQTLRRQPWRRVVLGRGFSLLCQLFFCAEIRDFTCGFKCFTARAAQDIFSLQKIKRWAFDAEILFLAKKLNYSIVQVPVTWSDEPCTKVRLLPDVLRSAWEIMRICGNNLFGVYRD